MTSYLLQHINSDTQLRAGFAVETNEPPFGHVGIVALFALQTPSSPFGPLHAVPSLPAAPPCSSSGPPSSTGSSASVASRCFVALHCLPLFVLSHAVNVLPSQSSATSPILTAPVVGVSVPSPLQSHAARVLSVQPGLLLHAIAP